MFVENIKPCYIIKKNNEKKKIFLIENDETQDKIDKSISIKDKLKKSNNCVIIAKDNKMLLFIRNISYYASYVYSTLAYKNDKMNIKKIVNCIENLYINEMLSLILVLDKKKIIQILSKEKDIIKNNVSEECFNLFDKCDYNAIFAYNNKYAMKILKFINGFLDEHIYENPINLSKYTLVLPNLNTNNSDDNDDILSSLISNEFNLKINRDNVKFLNRSLKFESPKEKEKIDNVLCVYTEDSVLKHRYYEYIYIINVDVSFDELVSNFKKNNIVTCCYKLNLKNNSKNNNGQVNKNFIKNILYKLGKL